MVDIALRTAEALTTNQMLQRTGHAVEVFS
jgi:hypothetical protein